jgi:hypothetical protein
MPISSGQLARVPGNLVFPERVHFDFKVRRSFSPADGCVSAAERASCWPWMK